MKELTSFSYCLESGRAMFLDDYYELSEVRGNIYQFRVYDACMYPSYNFEKWNPQAIEEVVRYIKRTFNIENIVVRIDGYEIK